MSRKCPLYFVVLCLLIGLYPNTASNPGLASPAVATNVALQAARLDEATAKPGNAAEADLKRLYANLPLYFVRNDGQMNEKVKFYESGGGHTTYYTSEAIYFSLPMAINARSSAQALIKLHAVGGNKNPEITAEGLQKGKVNYLLGNDPKKWHTDIPTYQAVIYKEIYAGIDLKFYGNKSWLEYDLIVKPGADPSVIRFAVEGIERLGVTTDGELSLDLKWGSIRQSRPILYQEINGERVEVEGSFSISEPFTYGFNLGDYDRSLPLIIDPFIGYSSFLGGSSQDEGYGIARDASGGLYVTGYTESSSFPIKGQFQTNQSGDDAFVSKFDMSQNGNASLVYSTYLGGDGGDYGADIQVDGSGQAHVTGHTRSSTFPIVNGFQTSIPGGGGNATAFLTKFNAAGNGLLYSTYLGGSNDVDIAHDIDLDSGGNAYLSGRTNSSNFPVSAGAFDTVHNGGRDVFVAKMNPNASGAASRVYATFVGAGGDEEGNGISVDTSGRAYVTGYTLSNTFPTVNAFDSGFNGSRDAFVLRVNATGSALDYSTFLGGSNDDTGGGSGNAASVLDEGNGGGGIDVDGTTTVCVTGETQSNTFPTTSGAFDNSFNGSRDVFVARIDTALSGASSLLYSTYLGAGQDEAGFDIATNGSGQCCVTGYTNSSTFPTKDTIPTSSAVTPSTYNGASKNDNIDAFLVTLNLNNSGVAPDATDLVSSNFMGGDGDDVGFGVAVGGGECCFTGRTNDGSPDDFPVTTSDTAMTNIAFQTTHQGSRDTFVTCVSEAIPSFAKLISFTASGYDGGVLLEWRSSYEIDNLGFNIYREVNGKRERLTNSPIAGSALLAGPSVALTSGKTYSLWDSLPADSAKASYWIEDIDLNGESSLHGPIETRNSVVRESTDSGTPLLLSQLGAARERMSGGFSSGPVERRAKTVSPSSARLKLQSNLASGPAMKLSILREGWYRVTQPELVAAGLDPKADPRLFQMQVDGRQVPILVAGEGDGQFDPSDAVEFYGIGLDSPSSDVRTYWFATGIQPGQRIKKVAGGGLPVMVTSFPRTVERRDRSIYFSSLRNGEAENFFGAVVTSSPLDQALVLRHLDRSTSGEATLELTLQGVTQTAHSVQVLFNGIEVETLRFNGQEQGKLRVPLPNALLREGENRVGLMAQGGNSDVSLVDSIRLTYQHSFRADNDALQITIEGGQEVTVDGFTSDHIRVLDVTDPHDAQEVAAKAHGKKEDYAVTVAAPGLGQRTLLAFTDKQINRPAGVAANEPSNWREARRGADLVIIARREFFDSLKPLVELRQSQGISVAVVDIKDIYDEFSYGQKTPQAVKDFLAFAKGNWQSAPRFVLLAADATFDPKNYLGHGDFDLVPTKLVDTAFLETASDDWFVDFDGDGLAEIAVGRLPARTADEARAMAAKIIGHERSAPSESVLVVADSNDSFDFEAASQQLRALIPGNIKVEEINRGRIDGDAARARLIEALNRGQKVVNYMGHGSVDIWRGGIFTSADARALTNGHNLSLFITMTCLNGYFHDVALDSLAESLLKADHGGAVAVWASSGLTIPNGQALMNQQLYRLIFSQIGFKKGPLTVGEATARAKAGISDNDVRRTWILFGDPSSRIR